MTLDYSFQTHLLCGHKGPRVNGFIQDVDNYIGEPMYCSKCNDVIRCIRLIILDNEYH